MADDTLLQFGPQGQAPTSRVEPQPRVQRALRSHVCPECGQRYSGDARFCPFDGAQLASASQLTPPSDPLIGRIIDDRYEVLELLGEGGMGSVYRARHQALGREFALKVLRRELASEGSTAGERDLSERFIQEARMAASINHPHVVQITDFGEIDAKQPYFVMELLEGVSLAWLLKQGGALPAGRAIRILLQVADALAAAHAAGVIHRDLKPDNIHVGSAVASDDDVVKVLDFGLAKVAGSSRRTRKGMVFGTPHYMSPEQASGEAVDHRSDIYALGVVMYEMFTGRVPFEADTAMGVLTKHMYVAPTPPSQLTDAKRELGGLEEIMLRCLEKKPAQRYNSLEEFSADLGSALSPEQASARASQPGRTSKHRNILADDLEPPSPEELKLRRRPATSQGAMAMLLLGGAMLIGAVGLLIATASAEDTVHAPAATSAVTATQTPNEDRGPAVVPVSTVETPEVSDEEPPVAPAPEPAVGRPLSPKPAVKAPVAPSQAPPTPKKKFESTDIIDPWAN